MVYDGPIEPDHAHEWQVPSPSPGVTVLLATCKHCSAVREFANTTQPNGAGESWQDLNEAAKARLRRKWQFTGSWE